MVEHSTENARVTGSNPVCGTILRLLALLSLWVPSGAFGEERILEVGDRIEVVSESDAGLSVIRTIEATGAVLLPRLGLVIGEGRTPSELAEDLQAKSRELGIFRVRVLPPSTKPVAFRGAVQIAGAVPIGKTLRLKEVLQAARPTDSAELAEVQVYAYDGTLAIFDFTAGENPEMRSGDLVLIPISSRPNTALVVGGVARPGTVEIGIGLTVRQALAAVGGTTNHGDLARVRLLRANEPPLIVDLNTQADVPLKRGDTLQVPLIADQGYVTISGNVKKEGMLQFRPGMTLLEALQQIGGAGTGAGIDRVVIKRGGGVGGTIRVDLRPILQRQSPDPALMAGDVVEVPFGGIRPKPKTELPKSGFPIPPRA